MTLEVKKETAFGCCSLDFAVGNNHLLIQSV